MKNWLKQLICAIRGHGGLEVEYYERDCMDLVEFGHFMKCKKCGKFWDEVQREAPKP
jgi:hypothetical protein